MLVEFGLKAFKQRERIGSRAGETGEHLVFVQTPYFARGRLHDDVAERYLPVSAHRDFVAASNREYRSAVELFSLHDGVTDREAKLKQGRGISAIYSLQAAPMLHLGKFLPHQYRVLGHAENFKQCRYQLVEVRENNALL